MCIEVEKNLSCNNIGTLTHWQLFNDLFPLNVSAGSNLSPTESLLYRSVNISVLALPLAPPLALIFALVQAPSL